MRTQNFGSQSTGWPFVPSSPSRPIPRLAAIRAVDENWAERANFENVRWRMETIVFSKPESVVGHQICRLHKHTFLMVLEGIRICLPMHPTQSAAICLC